jgi:hypothetical protein
VRILVGLALVGGAALVGRRRSAFGDPPSQKRLDRDWMEAVLEDARWARRMSGSFENNVRDIGLDPPGKVIQKTGMPYLHHRCLSARRSFQSATDALRSARAKTRGAKFAELVRKYGCIGWDSDRPGARAGGYRRQICRRARLTGKLVDYAFHQMKKGQKSHNEKVVRGLCPTSLGPVPLSGAR